MNEETERDEFTAFMRNAIGEWFTSAGESLLVSSVIISEWVLPSGKKVLTRNTVGDCTEWGVQGMLYNALHDVGFELHEEEDDLGLEDYDPEEE